ncbi:MAG: single-stranded DNA-binding protein [Acidimicrobiales bacterium]
MTNVVVLQGRLTRPAALRSLPSGDQLVALEVSIPREGHRAESAPVVWPDAPASATALDVDQEVLVVGRVRRRFFRAGGSIQSRTEVVADTVVPAGQSRRAKAALAKAVARLESV